MSDWQWDEVDDRLASGLQERLPRKVFDAHAHLYRVQDLGPAASELLRQGPPVLDREAWRERVERQIGAGRLGGGMFMSFPSAGGDAEAAEGFLLAQVEADPHSRALVGIRPDSDPGRLGELMEHPQVVGLKPYHFFSREQPTWESSIEGFLPEWGWRLAHERELILVLHLVRDGALQDPGNQRTLREMCTRYPQARLVLAHCARGFSSPNTVEGLPALQGLQNVWFDTSGICEPAAIFAILRACGPSRLLWGSDFPLTEQRGRAITLGEGFAWVTPAMVSGASPPPCRPTLVGLESLRALLEAADYFGLSAADLQDVFCANALRLAGIEAPSQTETQDLYDRAERMIPGGVQLLSKRPQMHAPGQWPGYFREARGCEVWDLDGRHYYDMSTNGIGSCLLGFAHPEVNRAVQRRVNLGSMSSLNPPEEVELAERLCELHPWAQQARFARCGGEAAAVAVRIARATTDRSLVAICGYHGWQDWYLAVNLGESDALRGHLLPGIEPLGVPGELRGTAHAFRYNDREAYSRILEAHGDRLAAVVMEPCRNHPPEPGFLEFVREEAHRCGALLIFDEISIGWRLHYGGAHLKLGVAPDLAVFAKALSNGYPMGAVIGTREAMQGAQASFISSTYWTEGIGPTAALAVLDQMRRVDVPAHVAAAGQAVLDSWQKHGRAQDLPLLFDGGFPCWAHFAFDHEQGNELRTLYTQLMLERGYLAGPSIYPTLAHTEEILARYDAAIGEVFAELAQIISRGEITQRLKGPAAYVGFKRLL